MPEDRSAAPDMVFVCGCGHSGTSLTLAMLGAHPEIYSIPVETGVFDQDKTSEEFRRFFTRYHRAVRLKRARILCEKTPRHILRLARMRAAFPDAKFIAPVRDPRDVVPSWMNKQQSEKASIGRWLRQNAIVREQIETAAGDFLAFRYEDLILDAPLVLHAVCAHIGVTYVPRMLAYHESGNDWFGAPERRETDGKTALTHRVLRNWQLHQPLMDRRGAWRDTMTAGTLRRIERECGELMAYFGYVPFQAGTDEQPARNA